MTVLVGDCLPSFALPDLDGRSWTRADLGGRPAVIFCFASWCTCKEQLPGWQRVWEERGQSFQMLAVAQEVEGDRRIRPIVEERQVTFPVLVDQASALAAALGFTVVPSGFFVDAAGVVRYRHTDDFDVVDPRVRWNLERFLAGEPTESPEDRRPMVPEALELFARGAGLHAGGATQEALELWRRAVVLDPDNFVVRSQLWVAEHPERFYPSVDRDWQSLQLVREGYDKPLP